MTSILRESDVPAEMQPVRIAASYARKSDENSDGIAVQHEINRKAAAEDGYLIPDVFLFSDDDTQGVTVSREGFNRIIALAEASPPFERVYVRNKKRLGRWDDSGMHDYYRIHLARRGVMMRYVEGANPDYSKGMTPEVAVQSLYDRLETIDASSERTETRKRVITGMRRRVVTGYWPGGSVPYGTQRWLVELSSGRLVRVVNENDGIRQRGCGFKLEWLHDGSFEAIQLIFQWVEEERLGSTEIARRLDALGLPPAVRPGRRSPHSRLAIEAGDASWTVAGVNHVLCARMYCGQLLWPKTARIEDAVSHLEANLNDEVPILHTAFMTDPPVTVEKFETVQEIIRQGRGRSASRQPAVHPLLAGLLRCARCDAPWYGHKGGRYYRHDTPRNPGAARGCPHINRYVRVEEIEGVVLNRVLPMLGTEWFVDALAASLKSHLADLDTGEQAREQHTLRAEMVEKQQQIDRVIEQQSRADDPDVLKGYERALERFAKERRSLAERVAASESRKHSVEEALDAQQRLVASATEMVSVYPALLSAQQKAVLLRLIESVRFDPDTRHAEVRLRLRL